MHPAPKLTCQVFSVLVMNANSFPHSLQCSNVSCGNSKAERKACFLSLRFHYTKFVFILNSICSRVSCSQFIQCLLGKNQGILYVIRINWKKAGEKNMAETRRRGDEIPHW